MTDKQPDALAKKLAKALEFDDFISVKLLRQAATLLRTQHKQIAAYELLTKSQEAQLSHHREQSDKYREAITTLQSERDANALLTAAIERKDALLRQALEAFEYQMKPLCMCFAGCTECDPATAPNIDQIECAIKQEIEQ